MIDLLYSTGIRVGELVNLNIDDIDLKAENVWYMEKGIRKEKFISMQRRRFI